MNVKILTLVIVLLVSLLCSASAVNEGGRHAMEPADLLLQRHGYNHGYTHQGPMASTEHGRELEEATTVRKVVQQNPARGGQSHRPGSVWKRRRPRPRLSHKGPMPF